MTMSRPDRHGTATMKALSLMNTRRIRDITRDQINWTLTTSEEARGVREVMVALDVLVPEKTSLDLLDIRNMLQTCAMRVPVVVFPKVTHHANGTDPRGTMVAGLGEWSADLIKIASGHGMTRQI
jgi:hypothetical protein